MDFVEHDGKALLRQAGVVVPEGCWCETPEAAAEAVRRLGPAAIKAQVAAGRRGKAGGVRLVETAEQARDVAADILALVIGGRPVRGLLVEPRATIVHEYYAAVLNDAASQGPLVLFSDHGGMDVEEIAAAHPHSIRRHPVSITRGFSRDDATVLLAGLELDGARDRLIDFLTGLYEFYIEHDAELVEINPLVRLPDGAIVALDCKLTVDEAALYRHPDLVACGAPQQLTELEHRGKELGLKYIELDGPVGVLANGAGLTMTTMDVIQHYHGRAANFLEIGGDAYTKATPALELVLANPKVRSLVINFCGAFARTDVMAAGVVEAWQTLAPRLPVFFSIHGTGEEEAQRLVRERLGLTPYEHMEDAVRAAVEAAR